MKSVSINVTPFTKRKTEQFFLFQRIINHIIFKRWRDFAWFTAIFFSNPQFDGLVVI